MLSSMPRTSAAPMAPSGDMLQFFQTRISEMEKRLYDAQEKALMFSLELKNREENQRQSVRQAEEILERVHESRKAGEQDKQMSERLGRLENICSRLDELYQETTSAENVAGVPRKDVLALLLNRLDSIESRLSVMEARTGESAVRSSLRDKLNSRDFTTMRDRMDRIEKDSVNLAYIEKRLSDSENDSSRVRKLEGELSFALKKLEKLDATMQAFGAELSATSAENKAGGSTMEELRAKFANMSVVFEYLRKEIEQIKSK